MISERIQGVRQMLGGYYGESVPRGTADRCGVRYWTTVCTYCAPRAGAHVVWLLHVCVCVSSRYESSRYERTRREELKTRAEWRGITKHPRPEHRTPLLNKLPHRKNEHNHQFPPFAEPSNPHTNLRSIFHPLHFHILPPQPIEGGGAAM